MNKSSTEVNIAGKNYTIAGYEDEEYIQRVASHINAKLSTLKKTEGYNRQSSDFRNMMLLINLADDFFKEKERYATLEEEKKLVEKELYDLKQKLVSDKLNTQSSGNNNGYQGGGYNGGNSYNRNGY